MTLSYNNLCLQTSFFIISFNYKYIIPTKLSHAMLFKKANVTKLVSAVSSNFKLFHMYVLIYFIHKMLLI